MNGPSPDTELIANRQTVAGSREFVDKLNELSATCDDDLGVNVLED